MNTRNLLRRKHMHLDDYSCVLCNTGCEGTSFHIFFECSFSQACWDSIPISWNLNLSPLNMMVNAREQFGSQIFREIVITTCWAIWTLRNSIIFDNGQCSILIWRRKFKDEMDLVCIKANEKRRGPLTLWRDSFHP